ncbi:uncharacterized protein BT62DRAFT_508222 [Guyanagaster necrorhizus]|uniref:Uncharacterized protein n=1 Tax=Guyanagaster necrorhizus TaxID=856835 RepID=A0A9P7W0Y2_9AGAR|nr:uncharacterized protein BT62DRAFT_508222 [Guyanagaster necrorhizus MCA 3950]KAG7450370.1 hypothetical protein BT62DRAFT_508222 [Guyanagaster necrorhizus MCA 3950]
MSLLRTNNHRRRSQSASTAAPLSLRCFADDSWRSATKRSRPHHPCSSVSPDFNSPCKSNVEDPRNKRRRRDFSPSSDSMDETVFSHSLHTTRPTFATTSAEFHLFPDRERNRIRRASRNPSSQPDLSPDQEPTSQADLTSLHAAAFWELHRSVADNGEGFVRRMRDYEHTRSRADAYSKAKEAHRRGRKRSSLIVSARKPAVLLDGSDADDDDDVQIFSGEVSDVFAGKYSHHHRASSLDSKGTMFQREGPSRRVPSGNEHCLSSAASSVYASDDDTKFNVTDQFTDDGLHHTPPHPFTPALSFTASSNSSSISSLPPLPYPTLELFPHIVSPRPLTLPASRSEKALTALSLAMANGAGSIHDYDALRAVQPVSAIEECQVGEMWD